MRFKAGRLLSIFFLLASLLSVKAQDGAVGKPCRGCEILKHLDKSIQAINDSAFWLIRNGFQDNCDSCFFGMVDSLKSKFIHTSSPKYIIALDSLAANSDGAYAEDFENADMFFKNFKPFCDYIYNSGDTGMVFYGTIRELMYEIYAGPDQLDTAKFIKMKQYIKKQEALYHITGGEKKFIDSFIGRAKREAEIEDNSTQEEN